MKKIKLLFISLLALLLLVGCGDAKAQVSNGKDVLVQVGKDKFTKADLYEAMINFDGGNTIVKNCAIYIVNAQIPDSDEIKAKADEQMATLKEQYGDLSTALSKLGYDSEDALMADIIASFKQDALTDQYIDENLDKYFEDLQPLKVCIMYITTATDETETYKERAALALAEVKAGADFATVAAKYCTKSDAENAKEHIVTVDTSLDKKVSEYLKTQTAPGLSDVFDSNDNKGSYIVQVTVANKEQLKDDFKAYVKALEDTTQTMFTYYFEKHNFEVFDITAFNLLSTNYPKYLGK